MTGAIGSWGCAQGAEDDQQTGDDVVEEDVCGDGSCTGAEDANSCASDCAGCGDGSCSGDENQNTCPQDCGSAAVCGDGNCSTGENASNCAQDCGAQTACGDGSCNGTETMATCPGDCTGGGEGCGNALCEGGETPESCPADCGGGGGAGCGDGVCDPLAGECESVDILCLVDCILDDQCSAAAGGGGGTCDHDVCSVGGPLDSSCGTCEAAVCAADDWCCSNEWDDLCVGMVANECPGTSC